VELWGDPAVTALIGATSPAEMPIAVPIASKALHCATGVISATIDGPMT
jgi:hypothetical protein